MAKKLARKRATKNDPAVSDEVRCVFLVGNASFTSQAAAEAFKASNRRRTALETHVDKALAAAPVRGRKALREGVTYLADYMIANPAAFVSALSIGLGDAPEKAPAPAVEAAPAVKKAGRGRPRAAKKAAAPANGAPAKRRGRPSKASKEAAPAAAETPAPVVAEPVAETGAFPPPPL